MWNYNPNQHRTNDGIRRITDEELKDKTSRLEFAFRFLGKVPTTSILQLEVVVEMQDETDTVSDVGSNSVDHIVGMSECLALGTGG